MSKLRSLLYIIFTSIWILAAVLVFVIGLVGVIDYAKNGNFFEGWFYWGIVCAVLMLFDVLRIVFAQTKQSYREGVEDKYLYYDGYGNFFVRDRGCSGMIVGFIVSSLICIVIGPIWLIKKTYHAVRSLIVVIRDFRAMKW